MEGGRASCSKHTKHIDIQYFYIKEKVDSKEVDIAYYPTEDLVVDFFTIPLLAIDPVRINKKIFDRNEHERIL